MFTATDPNWQQIEIVGYNKNFVELEAKNWKPNFMAVIQS